MNRNLNPFRRASATSLLFRHLTAFLILLLCPGRLIIAQTPGTAQTPAQESAIHATHLLGFEGAKHHASGVLKIQGDALQFLRDGSAAAQVPISSIHNISVGEEDKQVGGVPMTVTKSAVPFGGGRVVSLFSHKKYDSFTIEYLDANGGFHGAIFQLDKGQAQNLKSDLLASGAHIAQENSSRTQGTSEVKNANN